MRKEKGKHCEMVTLGIWEASYMFKRGSRKVSSERLAVRDKGGQLQG